MTFARNLTLCSLLAAAPVAGNALDLEKDFTLEYRPPTEDNRIGFFRRVYDVVTLQDTNVVLRLPIRFGIGASAYHLAIDDEKQVTDFYDERGRDEESIACDLNSGGGMDFNCGTGLGMNYHRFFAMCLADFIFPCQMQGESDAKGFYRESGENTDYPVYFGQHIAFTQVVRDDVTISPTFELGYVMDLSHDRFIISVSGGFPYTGFTLRTGSRESPAKGEDLNAHYKEHWEGFGTNIGVSIYICPKVIGEGCLGFSYNRNEWNTSFGKIHEDRFCLEFLIMPRL